MVFLSTFKVLLGRSLSRSVFRFGFRPLTQHIVLDEIVMGLFLVFLLSLAAAHITVRLAVCGWRPQWIRSDMWTTALITVVGDMFLELLLPSLQCLPSHSPPLSMWQRLEERAEADALPLSLWLQQMWGFQCPSGPVDLRSVLLAPDAVGALLTIRLFFMCLGVYIGESFVPVALTGGIACGKSTVAHMLADYRVRGTTSSAGVVGGSAPSAASGGEATMTNSSYPNAKRTRRRSTKSDRITPTNTTVDNGKSLFFSDDEEGTVLVIDADAIAHEILLPPQVLAAPVPERDPGDEMGGRTYIVQPGDSVYYDILHTFGDKDEDNRNILDDNNRIDRRKLGAIVFADPTMLRLLNRTTHPRIIYVLIKRFMWGIFGSYHDIVCVDIPLLFESGQLRWLFPITIVVACTPEQQLQRLRNRNPDLSEQECRDRIACQMPIEEKMASIVIWNDGDLDALQVKVESTRKEIMGRIYGIGMSLLQMLLLVGGSLSLAVSSKLFVEWS